MPSKPYVPKFSPLGLMGLVHESCLDHFLTFIASIYWSLVSAPLPLEVQSWGRWWSPFILLTSADMTVLGHCSRQAGGGKKLMGQSLVHSQRLGSLVWVSSCLLASYLCVLTWAGLCAHVALGFHSLWTFISKYFWVFHKYLQWAFEQLVVMFETIKQVSKYFCEYYLLWWIPCCNDVHGF